jgi:hypothetical protein
LLPQVKLPKLLRFRSRRIQRAATSLLISSKRYRSRKPYAPERLGNLLQHLVFARPEIVIVVEGLVAEMLAQVDRSSPIG